MPVLTVYPNYDGFITNSPGTNAGLERVLSGMIQKFYTVGNDGVLNNRAGGGQTVNQRSFLTFDLSSLPSGASIKEIKLYLFQTSQGQARYLPTSDSGGTFYPGVTQINELTFSDVPDGGFFSLSFYSGISPIGNTSNIPYNASAADVQTAVRAVTGILSHSTVTGDFSVGFTITFTGSHGPFGVFLDNELTLAGDPIGMGVDTPVVGVYSYRQADGGTQVAIKGMTKKAQDYAPQTISDDTPAVQKITFDRVPTTGSFRLEYTGTNPPYTFEDSALINYNATAADVQTALRAMRLFADSTLTVSGNFIIGFTITFSGTSGYNWDLLQVDSNSLADGIGFITATPSIITVGGLAFTRTGGEEDLLFSDIDSAAAYNSSIDFGTTDNVILGGTAIEDAEINKFVAIGIQVDPNYPGPGSYPIWHLYFANFASAEYGGSTRPRLEITYYRRRVISC